MEQRYGGTVSRTLCLAERRVRVEEELTPLVIEPLKASSGTFLQDFLTTHSAQILDDISKHGALLLRGFNVASPASFEKIILSIRGMRGMKDILFQLPGRKASVSDTQFTYATSITSKREKTGGSLRFDLFHTENYGFPDVPSYVAFYCVTPSRLGGETGLVNLAKVYSDIPGELRQKLEERACLTQLHSVSAAAKKYDMHRQDIVGFCKSVGLPLANVQGIEYVAIFKPNVVQHPTTHERALVVNFNWVHGLKKPVIDAFSRDYSGLQWCMHRFSWRSSCYEWLRRLIASPPEIPGEDLYVVNQSPISDARSLASLWSPEDVKALAEIIRKRYCSFLWKKEDILIVDNLKTAHSGMPGRGDRELKIMMCNPVWFSSLSSAPGLHVMSNVSQPQECLGARLRSFDTSLRDSTC